MRNAIFKTRSDETGNKGTNNGNVWEQRNILGEYWGAGENWGNKDASVVICKYCLIKKN